MAALRYPLLVRTCFASSYEDRPPSRLNAQFLLQRAQYADIIRVATIQRAIPPHHHGVDCANLSGQWLAFFQMSQDGLLVRNGDAESADSKFGDGFQEIAELMHQKGKVNGIHVTRHKPCVVQQR